MFVDDYPDATLDEILAHHGVKGMHWGVRRSGVKADAYEIRSARSRLSAKANEYHQAKHNIRKAGARGSAERAMAKEKVAKLKTEFYKNPDRVTATRMTKGEKAAALILGAPTGFVGTAAGIAARSAISRHIEKKQARGGYDKKK